MLNIYKYFLKTTLGALIFDYVESSLWHELVDHDGLLSLVAKR